MFNAYALKGGYPVTPSDTTDLAPPSGPGYVATCLYIGSTGSVKVTTEDGSIITYPQINSGEFTPFLRITRVWATGTSASQIIAHY